MFALGLFFKRGRRRVGWIFFCCCVALNIQFIAQHLEEKERKKGLLESLVV